MSQITKHYKEIVEECNTLQKKKISKPRRRNQYTVEFKFGSNSNNENLKNTLQVKLQLPPSIPEKIVVRLQSNVQFPIEFNQQYVFGSLSVDPHSYNYKVNRIDKKDNLTIFTLETIDNPFTPFENLFKKLLQCNPRLAKSFQLFNSRNLDIATYKQSSEQIIEEFGKKLQQPYTCYLQRFKNGICSTVQRVINDKFMDLLGIGDEMLEDHVLKTNLLPFSSYIDPNDDVCEILSGMFEGNVKQDIRTREVMNYNGQIFRTRVQNRSFFTYDKDEDAFYEYSYYIYDCDSRWLSKTRVQRNQDEYFNEKLFNLEKLRTRLVSEDQQSLGLMKNCGFKPLTFENMKF